MVSHQESWVGAGASLSKNWLSASLRHPVSKVVDPYFLLDVACLVAQESLQWENYGL